MYNRVTQSMSQLEMKRQKDHEFNLSEVFDLADVPTNIPPIPSEKIGSSSRFKGVSRVVDKTRRRSSKEWRAKIRISYIQKSIIDLGYFDTEEEAGIMHARVRYKFPCVDQTLKPYPLDLSDVPMNLPPVPSNRCNSASRFKGVTKYGRKWRVEIPSDDGGKIFLGHFGSEEEAGAMYARVNYKYPEQKHKKCPLDLSDVPANLPPLQSESYRKQYRINKGLVK